MLLAFGSTQLHLPRRLGNWVRHLGSCSYAQFLVHFSVLLLANAAWATLGLDDEDWAAVFAVSAWALSLLLSHIFHTQVEQRIARWRSSPAVLPAVAAK